MVSVLGHRFKKNEILFGLFSVYVLLSYIVETWIFGDSSIVRVLLQLTLLHLGFGVVLRLSTITISKGLLGKIGLSVFVSYLFVLISDSVSSSSFTFSALRSIISFYILFISLIFFTTSILSHVKGARKNINHICIFLIPLFATVVVWHIAYGLSFQGKYGFRLHGWSNPNTIGQFALLPLFWSHYVSLRYEKWDRSHKLLWWLSLTVLLLSISRGAILCFIVTYTCYYTFKFAGNLAYIISSRYKLAKRKVFYVVSTLAIFVLIVFLYDPSNISYLLRAEEIGSRLTLRTVEQRLIGWKHLWPYFTSNPLTGGAGWWNATNIVEATAAYGGVTSPHSLYVRLLSEVGILGTVAVLSLPGTVVILLLKKAALTHVKKYSFYSSVLSISFILGLFVRQLFEDSYLVGFGEMGSSIIIFAISAGIIEIHID
jgi:O-antigen ligase